MNTIGITSKTVKLLGRSLYQDGVLWLASSGSGIEFTFEGTDLSVTILGDDNAVDGTEQARIAVYVDHDRILDDMVATPSKTYRLLPQGQRRRAKHHIHIIKLTESAMSIVGIKELLADADAAIRPSETRPLKLEFIGDSITCGYGVDDADLTHAFSTKTEDVTRAYAYLAAQTLQADYQMVSYSGYGVYSGYTEENVRSLDELVPPYYPLVGFSRGTVNGKAIAMTDWDFTQYTPDLIVINLGTNDDSYCQDETDRQEAFVKCYQNFLKLIREKNPDAYLLCVYGLMNNRLTHHIEKAVSAYTAETADQHISFLPLPTQTEEDGYVVNYHPSPATHKNAARIVSDKIREILNL